MTNLQIAQKLREMAAYYEMDGVRFKPQAYERAADSIDSHPEALSALYDEGGIKAIRGIPGVGEGIAGHIEQMLRRDSFPEYDRYRRKYPIDLAELISIEGVGPKTVKTLYRELGIRHLADLEKAARSGKLEKLPRFGAKTAANILKGIETLKKSGGRRLLGEILPIARKLESALAAVKGVSRAVTAGSVRRRQETVGDIDILVTAADPEAVMSRFAGLPEVIEVIERGPTKTAVRLENGMNADVRIVPEGSFGSALQYFTGSKDHNVEIRRLAAAKGLKLNEYGLWRLPAGRQAAPKALASRTEEDVYRALGLDYIEPELRAASGEIEAALRHKLPKLVPYGSLKGDMQVQTDWTDGSASIAEMAEHAVRIGLEYIAVTDHTKSLAMIGGLDERKLLAQGREIDALNGKLTKAKARFRVLKGTECDIKKDGSLDLDDEALARLDFVGVAVHSHFRLSRAEQTARVVKAMRNPHVDCVFHPTGRVIGRREPYELDMPEIIKEARRTGTALEIDAFPDRLDLKDSHIRLAVEAGVRLFIDTDAHHPSHLAHSELGVAAARRGWATKRDIINTRPLEEIVKWLKLPKAKRR